MPTEWITTVYPRHVCIGTTGYHPYLGRIQAAGAPQAEPDQDKEGVYFWDRNFCAHCGETMPRSALISPNPISPDDPRPTSSIITSQNL